MYQFFKKNLCFKIIAWPLWKFDTIRWTPGQCFFSWWYLRDCSLFMPKGGSVIFKRFRHMKIYPSPEVGILKNYPPPFMWQTQNVTPLTPTPLRTRRAYDCKIAYNMCSGRLPINQNPLQGLLWSYSMEALNKESEFAAPVLTWAQKRSDLREKLTLGKFVRSSLQGLNHEDVLLKLETKIINNGKGHARAYTHGLCAIMETMLHGSQF